jgi:hypothetical protein
MRAEHLRVVIETGVNEDAGLDQSLIDQLDERKSSLVPVLT